MSYYKSVGCAFAVVLMSGQAVSAEMAPHRAVYEITFSHSRPESQIVGGIGKWVLEVKGASCTGYNVGYRFVSKLQTQGGAEITLDTRGKYFESGDASAFDFANSIYQNNQLRDAVKGMAMRKDGAINVRLTKPEATTVEIEKEALFPVQHFGKLVEDAKAGKKLVNNVVYEGIEGAKTSLLTSSIILPEKPVEEGEGLVYQMLEDQKLRRWPVTISYFKPEKKGDGEPEWQNSFLLYENGVSRDFTFDYGDFALKGKMETLELLSKEEC
ncbi:MAG: DUF1849 family protein [Hyphomicrobiales bacterium]